MNPELKKKWVKALRSGEYKQGRGYLANKGKYCCLGVLAVACLGVSKEDAFGVAYLWHDSELPMDVQRALAKLNDERVPFEVIAGFIQENL
jgi:hypothetical protein